MLTYNRALRVAPSTAFSPDGLSRRLLDDRSPHLCGQFVESSKPGTGSPSVEELDTQSRSATTQHRQQVRAPSTSNLWVTTLCPTVQDVTLTCFDEAVALAITPTSSARRTPMGTLGANVSAETQRPSKRSDSGLGVSANATSSALGNNEPTSTGSRLGAPSHAATLMRAALPFLTGVTEISTCCPSAVSAFNSCSCRRSGESAGSCRFLTGAL
jgi:hypothetical protein